MWLKETKMNGEQVKYNCRATTTTNVYPKIPLALLMQKVPRQQHQFFGFYKGVSSLTKFGNKFGYKVLQEQNFKPN